ncbi:MAG: TSUP family transporter [Defluviitaleaceae bacterium]|nr:TSUP family transporter [Defluviitaleaceae bacterium]
MDPITVLLVLMGILAAIYAYVFIKDVVAHKDEKVLGDEGKEIKNNVAISGFIGFITNFFDTLGIGSFAPTTFAFKATKVVDVGVIPGTLNVAHTLPVVFMSFLYIGYVEVDFVTLISLIGASVVGAWLGAGVVVKFDRNKIQLIVGVALILVAAAMAGRNLGIIGWLPPGEGTLGLSGVNFVIGVVGFFILGALMTAGVGLYSPAMALVFLLGLSQPAAFPIMMGACAFLMSVAGIKFVKEGKYARKQSLAIGLLGLPGVFLAFQFFRGVFQMGLLIWLVVVVVTITALMMIGSYFKSVQK